MSTRTHEPLAYGVDDLCKVLGGIGRSTFYRLVRQGELHPFKVGSKTLIDASEAQAFIARKLSESQVGAAR